MNTTIKQRINESIELKRDLLENEVLLYSLDGLINEIVKSIKNGHKLVLCGNGGSASDALHFAGEIVGRFEMKRTAWPAIVLNADVSTMTAIGNDYGYDHIFERQAQGHCQEGDVFIGISTSGNSENVFKAVEVAKDKGCITAALLGGDGGKIGKVVGFPLTVPCNITARVQEIHILLIHIMCEIIEKELCDE